MDTDDPLVRVAVEATVTKLHIQAEAKQRADEQIRIRARAVWTLHHEHDPPWTYTKIANALRDSLLAAGFTDQEIHGAGVRIDSVRRICNGPKP